MLDYISVLAGGRCPKKCPFCIGNSIRLEEIPHFADNAVKFIKEHAFDTPLLSISGSTSDPLAVGIKTLLQILNTGRQCGIAEISLHTAQIEAAYSVRDVLSPLVDELCLSVNHHREYSLVRELATYFGKGRVRISTVVSSGDGNIDEFVGQFPTVDKFTFRKNIFSTPDDVEFVVPESFSKVGEIHNQPLFSNGHQTIALWDFKTANPNTKALYLWPDGKIRHQCHWTSLHTTA